MCSLSAANTRLCLDFFKELSKIKRNENIFFSPLSLSAAFGMVLLGARGNTLKQIEKVGFLCSIKGMVFSWLIVQADRTDNSLYMLFFTHSILFDVLYGIILKPCNYQSYKNYPVVITSVFSPFQQYLDSEKKFYGAELEAVDFKHTKEETREKINFWMENETKGKKNIYLCAIGSVNPSTVLVLVNAIYFKGKWAVEFKKEDTRKLQMMFQESYFILAVIEEPQMKVLELLYINNELSMFILLPEVVIPFLFSNCIHMGTLTYEKLAEWTSSAKMRQQRVKVYVPRFKMEESYILNKTLQEMGVINVFDWGKADLSGISRKDAVVVSKDIHKSFVEVNEEGTEAEGAVAVVAMPLCHPISYEFKADHPFLFFIRRNSTKNILFFGRYSSP
uniref:Serpin domain-containing protein n=1 Tax=Apteryx owenii TaxID=8824 RepID=A0A8B9P1N1_APTOW